MQPCYTQLQFSMKQKWVFLVSITPLKMFLKLILCICVQEKLRIFKITIKIIKWVNMDFFLKILPLNKICRQIPGSKFVSLSKQMKGIEVAHIKSKAGNTPNKCLRSIAFFAFQSLLVAHSHCWKIFWAAWHIWRILGNIYIH